MSQYKNIPGNKYFGGDTDSAIMEKELSPRFVGKGIGMMKKECSVKLGMFADKKLYLMQDDRGETVIKSRGVGRAVESGRDILTMKDFIKLFRGEVLKILKTKFIIQKDGVYVTPQAITVRISSERLLKIQRELKDIFANINHSLYMLALRIGRSDITSLNILPPLAVTPLVYSLIGDSLVLFKKRYNDITQSFLYGAFNGLILLSEQFSSRIYAGVIQFVFYVAKKGVNLDYRQFCSKINCGVMPYMYYVTLLGICVTCKQFNSKIYVALDLSVIYISRISTSLDLSQFQSKINFGLIVYNSVSLRTINRQDILSAPVIFVTPSGICLLSNDPRTNFIFRNYTIKSNSKRVIFKAAMMLSKR